MLKVTRFDRCELRQDAIEKTPEGYLKGRARLTRTGVFPYRADDGSFRRELRHPREVFARSSMDTLDKLAMQVEHRAILNAENMARFKVGQLGTDCVVDAPFIEADYIIDVKAGVDAVEVERRKEISLGYFCDLVEAPAGSVYDGQPYTHEQRNIRYNHVAITMQARLGPDVRLDSAIEHAVQQDGDPNPSTEDCMTQKVKTDSGLSYDASPEVAVYVAKLEGRVDSQDKALLKATEDAKAEKARTDSEISKLTGERDQAKADSAKAAKELKEHQDGMPEKVRKLAKDRADLVTQASALVDEETAAKFDTMSDEDIRKAVITADSEDVKLDGKDASYIQARFDSIVERAKADGSDGIAAARAGLTARQDSEDKPLPFGKKKKEGEKEEKTDSAASREAMRSKRLDSWQKPANGSKED